VSNVLNEQTKQQVIALGRLGWSLRRIQNTTGVRRETAAAYLREVGVAVRPRSAIADLPPATVTGADAGPPPAKPAIEVTTDFGVELATSPGSSEAHPDTDGTIAAVPPAVATAVVADPALAKPAVVRVLDSFTDVNEQLQSLTRCEFVIAVIGHRVLSQIVGQLHFLVLQAPHQLRPHIQRISRHFTQRAFRECRPLQ
jgi:hypothetical protein